MPVKILLAEDFSPLRKLISAMLGEHADFQVVGEVGDGLEVVEKAEELQPDLVLLDIGLPRLPGIRAAEQIRKRAPFTRLLFVSQESSPAIIRETFRVGGRGYIHKTSLHGDLIPAIETALGCRHFVSKSLQYAHDVELHPRHIAQFYRNDAALEESFARYVAAAVRAGDATILLGSRPHLDGVIRTLRSRHIDIDGVMQRGECIAMDAHEVLESIMRAGEPDCARLDAMLGGMIVSAVNATKKSDPRVAIAGEFAGILYTEGKADAALQIEEKGDEIVRTYGNVDIMCAFPMPPIEPGDPVFQRVCALHQTVHCG